MKTLINTLLFPIAVSALLMTSCGTDSEKSSHTENEKTIYIAPQKKGFDHSMWRIDSVAENNLIIGRPYQNSDIQVFNFEKTGFFSTLHITSKFTDSRPIGKWQIEKDSVFILGKNGNRAMSYGFEMKDGILILNGNFDVSSNNKKKPTFYLSKYVEH